MREKTARGRRIPDALSRQNVQAIVQLTQEGVKHIIRMAYHRGYTDGADSTIKAAFEAHRDGKEFEPAKVRECTDVLANAVADELYSKIQDAAVKAQESMMHHHILKTAKGLH